PVVDTNVKRVLARAVAGKDASEVPSARLSRLAADWLPAGEAYRWNQALMDIGAMVCRVSNPLCAKCPLRTTCAYRAKGRHRTAPVRAPKREERFEGSRRQKRGTIVDHLRRAARKGITVSELSRLMHPDGDGDPALLGEILAQLEKEGLAELTPAARKGSARGVVRLPSRAAKR
ncbi:MAG: hypothetical protein ACRDKG_11970, partial [Actinomycetota bacterium]